MQHKLRSALSLHSVSHLHSIMLFLLSTDTRSTIDIETGDALKTLWADKGKPEVKAEVKVEPQTLSPPVHLTPSQIYQLM